MCGEAAAGVNGANRVGQNALSDIIVSAAVAGEHAAAYVKNAPHPSLDPALCSRVDEKITRLLCGQKGVSPSALRSGLQNTMQKNAGVLRSEKSLKEALGKVEQLENTQVLISDQSRVYNRGLMESLENENLLCTARCIIASALERKESRGAHYRDDFPKKDDHHWLKNIILGQNGGGLSFSYKPVRFDYMKPGEEEK